MNIPEQEDIEAFDIKNLPYTERELHLQFRYYKESGDKFFDYKKMFYEDYKREVNSENSKGNKSKLGQGKIQKFINGLSSQKLVELQEDVNSLSVRKFRDKYSLTKRYVQEALENKD